MKTLGNRKGYTLAELMVVMVIAGIAMVAMAPQAAKMWKRSDLELVSTALETRLRVCRQKAVLNRKPYRLTVDNADNLFYTERRDSTGIWNIDPADTIHVKRGIQFRAFHSVSGTGNAALFFETRGTIAASDAPTTFRFWNAKGETLDVNIVRTGRVRVARKG